MGELFPEIERFLYHSIILLERVSDSKENISKAKLKYRLGKGPEIAVFRYLTSMTEYPETPAVLLPHT